MILGEFVVIDAIIFFFGTTLFYCQSLPQSSLAMLLEPWLVAARSLVLLAMVPYTSRRSMLWPNPYTRATQGTLVRLLLPPPEACTETPCLRQTPTRPLLGARERPSDLGLDKDYPQLDCGPCCVEKLELESWLGFESFPSRKGVKKTI